MTNLRRLFTPLLLAAVAACADRTATDPRFAGDPPDFAKGGGGGGDPTVTATDPIGAGLDTTLDIRVFGSNFDRNSRADLALAGVVGPKVHTNSTRYVSSNELVANVTIAVDADTGAYDVIVTTSTGKKGIGTEMFEVSRVPPGQASVEPEIAVASNGDIMVMNADGSHQAVLGVTDFYSFQGPTFARAGEGTTTDPFRIAYQADWDATRGNYPIGIVDFDTVGGVVRVTGRHALHLPTTIQPWGPSWSPLGDTIAFGGAQNDDAYDGVWLVSAADGVPVRLYAPPPSVTVQATGIAWSPDARAVAFVEETWGMSPRPMRLVVFNRPTGVVSTIVADGVFRWLGFADWSRDGTQLAFRVDRLVRKRYVRSIYVVPLTTDASGNVISAGAPRFVTDGHAPSWSRDSRFLAIEEASVAGVRVVDAATGAQVRSLGGGEMPDWRR